jgi:hypothetical protein
MDSNTKLVKEGVEQIATLVSDLVVKYAQEENVTIGSIEQGMRQVLQRVGRCALGQVLSSIGQERPG